MWTIVSVVEQGAMVVTQQLSRFVDLGSQSPSTVTQVTAFDIPQSSASLRGNNLTDDSPDDIDSTMH